MAEPTDEQLREAARHRGLKLLKSRRRKPGGDFGLYGLAAPDGAARFGVGEDGLTATAAEVAAFLRKGDAATWATSVEATPEPKPKPRPAPEREAEVEPEPAIRRRPPPRVRSPSEPDPAALPRRATDQPDVEPPAARARASARQAPRRSPRTPPTRPRAVPAPPSPPPKAELRIRSATRADAAAVAALIANADEAIVAERLAAATALGEAVLVADEGGVIGCLAWHVVPTLQHGPIARITYLAVTPGQQRRGIGRRLVDTLAETAAARDLPLLEAISDIAIESAHGFFRRLGFAQTSYRFARALNSAT